MQTYYLTVYAQTGEALLNESFEAENDEAATNMGKEKLNENGHADITIVSYRRMAVFCYFIVNDTQCH